MAGALILKGRASAREYIRFFRDPVGCMSRLYQRHGPLVALGPIAFGEPTKLHVLAIGPAHNRQVLGNPAIFRTTGQFIRGPENSAQRRIRYGLTRMTGADHKRQRQLVMPPFHKKAVDGYHELIRELTTQMLHRWRPGRIDVHREMRELTRQVAGQILFGHNREVASRLGRMLEDWQRRNFSSAVWLFPVNWPGTMYRRLLKLAETIEEEILAVIDSRRANGAANLDVLSLLIAARDQENRRMSNRELVGQATILFGASFETTAATLTWTIFLLAQHPAVMEKLMEELDSLLQGEPPEKEQLSQLSYLDWVIKESMRILPPVPFTIRATDMDKTTLGPLLLLHGTRVICSHYLTHRLPHLYPRPAHFEPERWRDLDPTQYEYLPFSAGPRACIGAMFAWQVLKVSLALILQRFRFTIVPGARVDRVVRITMVPRWGLPAIISPNDRKFTASKVGGEIHQMVELPTVR